MKAFSCVTKNILCPVYLDINADSLYHLSGRTGNIDRLQLLMNETSDSYDVGNTPASVGAFTKTLLDINANQTPDAFPSDWILQSVPISGLNGTVKTRLAFRYVVSGISASSIGVDAFTITPK